ncbi:MAG: MotA/TolQ/ExbB proton channel family protein [Planctomycetes bacterium]|nr:MotA/TolQ/ExbB proton channel family protein [Planctomycetota bacterium]
MWSERIRLGVVLLAVGCVMFAGAATAQEAAKAEAKAPAKVEEAKAPAKAEAKAKGPAPDEKAAAAELPRDTLIQYIKYGGAIGYVIMLLSVVGLTLLCKQLASIRLAVLAPPAVREQLNALLDQRKIKDALEYCNANDSMLTRVVAAGINELRSGHDAAEKAMIEVGEEESLRLHQAVGYLSLIGAIAPMLGLLGTVQGMIGAFSDIAHSAGLAKPADLAYNIQKALVTTFQGLVVAIPVLCAFAIMRNRVTRIALEVGVIASDMMARFKGLRLAVPSPQPAPAPKPAEAPPTASSTGS